VRYEEWIRFVLPMWLMLMVLGAVAIAAAMLIPGLV
jgi:uncharacterized ion transporter superfamily protein YfcC